MLSREKILTLEGNNDVRIKEIFLSMDIFFKNIGAFYGEKRPAK